MTGQLPLAIAELLIKCIPALGATSDDDATAVTPVLRPHTDTSLAFGNQQDAILILGYIARGAFLVSVLLFPPHAQLPERALEVLSEGHLVGGYLVRLFPANRWASGGEIRELCSGMRGRGWKGGSKIALSSAQVDVVEQIWGDPLNWTGTNTVCALRKTRRVISGVNAVGGK